MAEQNEVNRVTTEVRKGGRVIIGDTKAKKPTIKPTGPSKEDASNVDES